MQNARIRVSKEYVPLYKIKCIDEKNKIWEGQAVPETLQGEEMSGTSIIFSRRYDKDNTVDQMLCEHEFNNGDYLDKKILLIPRQKILFFWDAPSVILKPAAHQMNDALSLRQRGKRTQ